MLDSYPLYILVLNLEFFFQPLYIPFVSQSSLFASTLLSLTYSTVGSIILSAATEIMAPAIAPLTPLTPKPDNAVVANFPTAKSAPFVIAIPVRSPASREESLLFP